MDGQTGISTGRRLAPAWRTIALIGMGLAGLAVLVALIVTLGEANRQRDRALGLQSHSYDVTILARTLSATIAQSEASLGRYVISGDQQLGRLYFEDWRRAGDQIDRLERLTRDNAEQTKRIEALRRAYGRRGNELSLTALSTNYGKNGQALARYYQARKAPALAEISRQLDAIIAGERSLLRQRTEAAMAGVAWSTRAARVLAAFGAALVLGAILLGGLTVRATRDRALARADAEAERRRAEDLAAAVAAATETLRQQEARLSQSQKMEAVGQLTGGIAHDFNNMLAVILGGLELARRGLANGADIARHIDSATDGATRAAALTRRLLAFAREEAINPEPLAVAGLIAGMRDLLDRTLGDGIRIAVVDESRGWRVRADRVQFENSILNLAVNARDAMDGRGTLTVTACAVTLAAGEITGCGAGDHCVLSVRDTGHGMTPEVAARVFEPFFTTKPIGKGTGLGLSQIFGFIRQLGGGITIETAPGEGTTVSLYAPRELASAPAPAPVATAPTAAASLSVLVVEDDPRVLRATVGALEELGHVAFPCDDPREVAALLDHGPAVDLIVTDVLMPGMTGPEMIAALDPRHAGIAVLFVTGFAGEAGGAIDFGGRPVLRKPYTLAALERAIGDAMAVTCPERPGQPPSGVSPGPRARVATA